MVKPATENISGGCGARAGASGSYGVKVTPEMLDAGAQEFYGVDLEFEDYRQLASSVFEAMMRARPRSQCEGLLPSQSRSQ